MTHFLLCTFQRCIFSKNRLLWIKYLDPRFIYFFLTCSLKNVFIQLFYAFIVFDFRYKFGYSTVVVVEWLNTE